MLSIVLMLHLRMKHQYIHRQQNTINNLSKAQKQQDNVQTQG
jgi:hypothetical protein